MAARYRIELSAVQGRELRRRAARLHASTSRGVTAKTCCCPPSAAPPPRSPSDWTAPRKSAPNWRRRFAQEGIAGPYPDGAAFVAADLAELSSIVARHARERRPVVLVYSDGDERILTPGQLTEKGAA